MPERGGAHYHSLPDTFENRRKFLGTRHPKVFTSRSLGQCMQESGIRLVGQRDREDVDIVMRSVSREYFAQPFRIVKVTIFITGIHNPIRQQNHRLRCFGSTIELQLMDSLRDGAGDIGGKSFIIHLV